MNKLLKKYIADVEFSEASGAEHLEMLQIRDQLFRQEQTLSTEEQTALDQADRRLIEQSARFFTELSRFLDLPQRRQIQHIPVTRWWWYLDVLAQLPQAQPANLSARSKSNNPASLAG